MTLVLMIKDYFGLASGYSNIVQDCCELECVFIAMGTITLNHTVIHKVHRLIFNNKGHYIILLYTCCRHTISFTMLQLGHFVNSQKKYLQRLER